MKFSWHNLKGFFDKFKNRTNIISTVKYAPKKADSWTNSSPSYFYCFPYFSARKFDLATFRRTPEWEIAKNRHFRSLSSRTTPKIYICGHISYVEYKDTINR